MSADKEKSHFAEGDDEKKALKDDVDQNADGDVPSGNHEKGKENGDDVKIQFVNGGSLKADCTIVLPSKEDPDAFVGMTKEELAKFAKDPYWVRIRLILLILFWLAWFGMLAAAIIIIVLAPKCPPIENLDWWQKSSVYQVYPKSFKDSNGDGNGDINGIAEKLSYINDHVDAKVIWLNNIHGLADSQKGYTFDDYKSIDTMLGTIEELAALSKTMHKKGMKLMIDFLPTDAGVKSALDLQSAEGIAGAKEVLEFWTKHGVDGFVFDSFDSLSLGNGSDPSTYDFIRDWRAVLDDIKSKDSKTRALIIQSKDLDLASALVYDKGAHMSIGTALNALGSSCRDVTCVRGLIEGVVAPTNSTSPQKWFSWSMGDFNLDRVATRLADTKYVNLANILLLTLRGTAFTYYGEEIGMIDVPEALQSKSCSPMQWSGKANAGFSTAKPWVDVANDLTTRNVMDQQASGSGLTNLEVYEAVGKLRQNASFQWGKLELLSLPHNPNVLAYVRHAEGFARYLVALNVADNSGGQAAGSAISFHEVKPELVPKKGKVVAYASGDGSSGGDLEMGRVVNLNNLVLRGYEAIIVEWAVDAVEKAKE